jgi:hypothetical protein
VIAWAAPADRGRLVAGLAAGLAGTATVMPLAVARDGANAYEA